MQIKMCSEISESTIKNEGRRKEEKGINKVNCDIIQGKDKRKVNKSGRRKEVEIRRHKTI
jgi:hypothetical protein